MTNQIKCFCENLLNYGQVKVIRQVGIVMVVLGVLYIITSFVIIYFIKLQGRQAQEGDQKALSSVVFPIYLRVMWANAFVNLFIGLICFSFDFHPFGSGDSLGDRWTFATMWALQHVVVEGVALLLMQKGLGRNAVKRVLKPAMGWGLWTLFVRIVVFGKFRVFSFLMSLLWNMMLVVFYFFLWVSPQRKLYRRPAAIIYARFWFWYRLLCIFTSMLYFFPDTFAVGNCLYVFGSLFGFTILEPLVMYYTFLQDSRWWQGLDISQGRRAQSAEEIRSPLAGVDINHKSALSLAASLDVLASTGPSRSANKAAVRLLNFAYISLDQSKLLGSGSFSKVYRGKYRTNQCAIKLIFTIDLTEDIIRRVAAEAQLLSSIKHINVVEIMGVSVLPPSVCILLELCQFGSLADLIGGTGSAHLRDAPGFVRELLRGGPMIGRCASGLTALHEMANNTLCHRDVKSFNFLVDGQLNAKISDLELGITDDLLVNQRDKVKRDLKNASCSEPRHRVRGISLRGSLSSQSRTSSSESVSELGIGEGVLAADEFLANWAAPEVIRSGVHSQASDVFSLGLVLWEILSGAVPFSDVRKQDDIRFKVLAGERPDISDCFSTGPDKIHFAKYISIIQKCWAQCEEDRPSAQQVLAELEMLLQNRCYDILRDTDAVSLEGASNNTHSVSRLFSNHSPSINSILSDDIGPTTVRRLQRDSGCLEEFSKRGESWLLVIPDSSLTIVWATSQFEDATGVSMEHIQGKSFAALSCFETLSPSTRPALGIFFQKLRESKVKSLHHVLMELETSHAFSVKPDDEDELGRKKMHTLFSIHAFPIANRSNKQFEGFSSSDLKRSEIQERKSVRMSTSEQRENSFSMLRQRLYSFVVDEESAHPVDIAKARSENMLPISSSSPLKTIATDIDEESKINTYLEEEILSSHNDMSSQSDTADGHSSVFSPERSFSKSFFMSKAVTQQKATSVSLVAMLFTPLRRTPLKDGIESK